MTNFRDRLNNSMRSLTDEWTVIEETGIHPLDKTIRIITPGFIVPENSRQLMRDLAAERVPFGYRTTFIFET